MHSWNLCTPGITYTHAWVIEAHIECQAKCNDKQCRQNDHPAKGVEDINEHQDVDASQRKLLKEDDKVDPGQKYCYGSDLPLPCVRAEALVEKHKGKDDGADKEHILQPVDPAEEVSQAVLEELEGLYDEPEDSKEDDYDG